MSAQAPTDAHLMGQESDGAKAAVRAQRDLKRKKDSLRKLEKKMKSMKADDASYAEAAAECRALKEEIDALEAAVGDTSAGVKSGAAAKKAAEKVEAEPARRNDKLKPQAKCGADAAADGGAGREAAPLGGQPPASSTAGIPAPDPADGGGGVELGELVRENIERSTRGSLFPLTPPLCHQDNSLVHYQVAELALMMESMMIVGGNARTFAMIEAFKSLLKSTQILSGPSLRDANPQDFVNLINVNFEFLRRSREPSAGMTHVKEFLVRRVVALLSQGEKSRFSADDLFSPLMRGNQQRAVEIEGSPLTHDGRGESTSLDGDPREMTLNVLRGIEKELQLSTKSIVEDRSLSHLSSNDTILVFGRSSTVELILLGAASNPRLTVKPKVIVVDSAPLYEGRALAKRLTCSGLSVTYGLITTCCTLMPRCTRVFIGAAAVLQNGDVFSRCGTAVVVASAKQYRKPVLCFSESFKFVPEVWLGNLGQNTKLIDVRQSHQGEHRVHSPGGWSPPSHHKNEIEGRQWSRGEENPHMRSGITTASGYLYDLTPAAYVDMIICEMGCLHTSAIVAALRDREDRDAYLISAV